MKNKTIKKTVTPTIEEQQQLLNLYNQGLFAETIKCAEAFIARFPEHGFGWKILGATLQNLGHFNKSLIANKKLVELVPNDAQAHNNLACTFMALGEFKKAEKCCYDAIRLEPNFIEAHDNLISIFEKTYQFVEKAEKHLKILIQLTPDNLMRCIDLGSFYFYHKKYLEAERAYEFALLKMSEHSPMYSYAKVQNTNICKILCNWENIVDDRKMFLSQVKNGLELSFSPMSLLSVFDIHHVFYSSGCSYTKRKLKYELNENPLISAITNSHQKLRIGYLSADFHNHATVYLMAGILENRNTENFDIYLYSYGVEAKDTSRSRVGKACEVFRHVRELSDEEIAQQIVADEIDILVDLKDYTEDSRLGIQALRPAPIVVSWLGYPSTLGHERLADYIIGDPTVTPLEHAEHFSETLALMPYCYQPNDNTRPIGACPTRKEAGLPETGFVFATFNQAYKITPEMFDIWCRLLEAAPNSVLWILEPHEVAQENLRREMTARGVDSSRLIFAPKMAQTEHLGRLQLADLAVDTFPCCSHTTASDALWAGVPLVTKMGETFASRVAASILRTMDLAELVTDNDDDYFNVALSLAQNPEKLAAIKQKIAVQKQTSPLFDTQKFAHDLERLYQTIWAQELLGERKAVVLEFETKSVDCEFITDANL